MWKVGKCTHCPQDYKCCMHYTMLTAGSKQVSIVVQNMMDSAIFLKKGVCVAHVVSAMLVPPEGVPSEQVKGMQMPREHMSVQERQDKLMDKLNS